MGDRRYETVLERMLAAVYRVINGEGRGIFGALSPIMGCYLKLCRHSAAAEPKLMSAALAGNSRRLKRRYQPKRRVLQVSTLAEQGELFEKVKVLHLKAPWLVYYWSRHRREAECNHLEPQRTV